MNQSIILLIKLTFHGVISEVRQSISKSGDAIENRHLEINSRPSLGTKKCDTNTRTHVNTRARTHAMDPISVCDGAPSLKRDREERGEDTWQFRCEKGLKMALALDLSYCFCWLMQIVADC